METKQSSHVCSYVVCTAKLPYSGELEAMNELVIVCNLPLKSAQAITKPANSMRSLRFVPPRSNLDYLGVECHAIGQQAVAGWHGHLDFGRTLFDRW